MTLTAISKRNSKDLYYFSLPYLNKVSNITIMKTLLLSGTNLYPWGAQRHHAAIGQ